MIRKKSVQCTLITLFLAGSLTGCSLFGASDPLLEPYAVAYNTNISAMQDMAGDRTDLFADDLVVVGDESGYQDETIKAEAAIIYNVTSNQVVFSHNAFERLYPASITKLMTVLVALKYGNLSDSVTVGDDIVKKSELKGTSPCKAAIRLYLYVRTADLWRAAPFRQRCCARHRTACGRGKRG